MWQGCNTLIQTMFTLVNIDLISWLEEHGVEGLRIGQSLVYPWSELANTIWWIHGHRWQGERWLLSGVKQGAYQLIEVKHGRRLSELSCVSSIKWPSFLGSLFFGLGFDFIILFDILDLNLFNIFLFTRASLTLCFDLWLLFFNRLTSTSLIVFRYRLTISLLPSSNYNSSSPWHTPLSCRFLFWDWSRRIHGLVPWSTSSCHSLTLFLSLLFGWLTRGRCFLSGFTYHFICNN